MKQQQLVTVAAAQGTLTARAWAVLMGQPLVARGCELRVAQTGAAVAAATTDLAQGVEALSVEGFWTTGAINQLLASVATPYLLLMLPGGAVELGARAIERFVQVAQDTGAAWVYSDYRERTEAGVTEHPTIDYQRGSVRDTFDFGAVVLLDVAAARAVWTTESETAWQWGALYDLRLRLAERALPVRIPEPLYTRGRLDARATGEKLFDYVDPRQRAYQIEMEAIATAHLQRIGAWLAPQFADVPALPAEAVFPVTASVVIPVRNRAKTIAEAVRSARAQQTSFAYNVIVVDNHSTDGTTDILRELAASEGAIAAPLVHLTPARTDLGIGGCWNEALFAAQCGRYAVQLDSDDIYADEHALAKIVAAFQGAGDVTSNDAPSRYAMVIGSYTIVDFDLNELPPGLIDHREWTRENGRNNALRINGLGAPRAFDVGVLRAHGGLPNVSYGEDYAVALRLSRNYEIGRIYESLYYARRWSGNSDSALPLATANRYDAYKDWLRTQEIAARCARNQRQLA